MQIMQNQDVYPSLQKYASGGDQIEPLYNSTNEDYLYSSHLDKKGSNYASVFSASQYQQNASNLVTEASEKIKQPEVSPKKDKNEYFSSSVQATRKSSLISSLVLNQKQIQSGEGQVTESKIVSNTDQKPQPRSRHFTSRNTKLAASLQDEHIQLQKLLNPWSSVIGGQSKRYF